MIATGEQHSVREFVELPRPANSTCRSPGRAQASTKQAYDQTGDVHRARRSPLFPPDRGGNAARRRQQGQARSLAGRRRPPSASWSTEMVTRRPESGQARRAGQEAWLRRLQLHELTHRRSAMKKDSKIYVAGHRGLVGSAWCGSLQAHGYSQSARSAPMPSWI